MARAETMEFPTRAALALVRAVSYWLQPSKYHTDVFREAWNRIGRGDVS